ncbi:MAG TPA: two-component regulator propeller domain-containing protein, partial [Gemmatimonadales bacterium]|nr:two-component regulator propeller domain-containing protein [Gemmatimonadales bacterium]
MPIRASSLALCFLWATPLAAQSAVGEAVAPHFLSRAWTSQDGLPDSRVTAIVAGRDGFVWIGTRRGLARFDGAGFRVFTHDNYPTLPSDEILSLALAKDSTLWVGTVTGVVRYRNGRFLPASLPSSQRNMRVGALLALADGGMVVTTTELSVRFPADTLAPATITRSSPQALLQSRDGTIWALRRSLARLGQEETPDTVFSRREYERALAMDSTGAIWITDVNHLLVRRGTANGRTYQVFGPEQGLPAGSIRALATAADGAVWVALDGGGVFRHSEGGFTMVPVDTIAAGSVRVLAAAPDGSIWIGSNTGLNNVWAARFTTHRSGRDLARDFVWQVSAMDDSSLWLATNAGGPMRLKSGALASVPSVPVLPDRLVSVTAQSRDGSIWLAFRGGGIGRWQAGHYKYEGVLPGADGLEARSMLEDRNGTLWIATGQGLYQRDATGWHRYTEQDGLADHDIYVIRQGRNGELWLAGANALSRRDSLGRFHALIHASDKVLGGVEDLEVDGDRLWLTTFRDGLALYRGGHLTVFHERVPSLLREAHRVMPDSLGFLWISSNLGLQRVRTADLLAVAQGRVVDPFVEDFDRDDGLLSAEFNSTGGASGARTPDGHLWFPSPVGLVEVNPREFKSDTAPPRAVIDQVLLDDRDVTSEVGDRLSWRGGRLTIRYTTPAMRKSRSQ